MKPNLKGERLLFLMKAKVRASMKSTQYTVHVHLDQESGDAEYAKYNCKEVAANMLVPRSTPFLTMSTWVSQRFQGI